MPPSPAGVPYGNTQADPWVGGEVGVVAEKELP
jgi:hypothetical protein